MPMARYGAFAARSCAFLWHSVRAAPRGSGLSPATGNPFAGTDRTHADRLRARRLLAGVVDAVGLPVAGSVSGRPGDRRGLRRIRASDRVPVGGQSLRPQSFRRGSAAPVFAGRQGRLVRLGASPAISESDPG